MKLMAMRITRKNYDIAAALLGNVFATFSPKQVKGGWVVINEKTAPLTTTALFPTSNSGRLVRYVNEYYPDDEFWQKYEWTMEGAAKDKKGKYVWDDKFNPIRER